MRRTALTLLGCVFTSVAAFGIEPPAFPANFRLNTFGNGIADAVIADLDGDGLLDIAVIEERQRALSVMYGGPDGETSESFTLPLDFRPGLATVGPVGEGLPHVIVAGVGESLYLQVWDLSNRDAPLAQSTLDVSATIGEAGLTGIALEHGRVLGNQSTQTVALYSTPSTEDILLIIDHGAGNVNFINVPRENATAVSLSLGDLNGDGSDEMIVGYVDPTASSNRLSLNAVTMDAVEIRFSSFYLGIDSYFSRETIIGDFDGNGHEDIVAFSAETSQLIFFPSGGSPETAYQFAPTGQVVSPLSSMGGVTLTGGYAADLNRDGYLDIAGLFKPIDESLPGAFIWYFGDGTGRFYTPGVVFDGFTAERTPDVWLEDEFTPVAFIASVPNSDDGSDAVFRVEFDPAEVTGTALAQVAGSGQRPPRTQGSSRGANLDSPLAFTVAARGGPVFSYDPEISNGGAMGKAQFGLVLRSFPWIRPTVGLYGLYQQIVPGVQLLTGGMSLGVMGHLGFGQMVMEAGAGFGAYVAGLSGTGADVSTTASVGVREAITVTVGIGLRLMDYVQVGVSFDSYYRGGLYGGGSVGLYVRAENARAIAGLPPLVAPDPSAFRLSNPLGGGAGVEGTGLALSSPTFNPVYPVLYQTYENEPFGKIVLSNPSTAFIENVVVTLESERFVDTPVESARIDEIDPGQTYEVGIVSLFTSDITDIVEGEQISASLEIQYTRDLVESSVSIPVTLDVRGRNAIEWSDDKRVAAYVTTLDDTVREFGTSAASAAETAGSVNKNLQKAVAIFEAIREHGVTYVIDPNSAYEDLSESGAVDYVQYPAQTLRFRAGDCDDLSVLYNAVLESVGIESAFLLYPGHIYVALRLDLGPEEAERLFSRPQDLLYKEDGAWLPLEITLLNSGFTEAWAVGARDAQRYEELGQLEFLRTSDAWASYPPVQLRDMAVVSLPTRDRMAAVYQAEIVALAERETAALAQPLLRRLERNPSDRSSRNRLGALYARYGDYERARGEFETILEQDSAYGPALANLAGLAFIRGDYETALNFYDRATAATPERFAGWLGAARSAYQIARYEEAAVSFERARRLNPDATEPFSYLAGAAQPSARASQAVAGIVVWDDLEEE